MAQIRQVVSESLQATVRRLLPSQQGFTEDLQASNVIMPIIDLTKSAEGSGIPDSLQFAWDFSTGHNTVANTTTTLVNTAGFWKIGFTCSNFVESVGAKTAVMSISDGLTSKVIWESNAANGSNRQGGGLYGEFNVFLRAGDSLTANTNNAFEILDVWYRQLADVNGNLTDPNGFTPQ